jgi:diguanylate cyclase (GGDEF)-like protein
MLALLRERADTLILNLDNAARTDALTGALNRRAFDDRMAEELARVRRTKRDLSLLVLDIDRFKQINDRYGHHSGDRALQHLTHVLTDCRRADQVGRLGGDEFAVLLPETDVAGARELADRIFARLRERPTGESFALAVSMGISCWPHHGRSAAELSEAADRAMYIAKGAGGHRALTFDASMRAASLPAH